MKASQEIIWLHQQMRGNIGDIESPIWERQEELKEDLKINVDDHIKEGQELKLENTDPKALLNNPFTGEIDEESHTPGIIKQKRLAQLKGRAFSCGPS